MSRESIRLGPVTVTDIDRNGVIRRNDLFEGPFVPGPEGGRRISIEEAQRRLADLGLDRPLAGMTVARLRAYAVRINRAESEYREMERRGVSVWTDLEEGIGSFFEVIGEPFDAAISGLIELCN